MKIFNIGGMKNIMLLLYLLFGAANLFAQDNPLTEKKAIQKPQEAPFLSLEDAVSIALKNNYNIRLAKNNSKIAATNVTIGNAGYLPVLDGTLSNSSSVLNVNQLRSDGTENNLRNLHNTTTTYGPSLNWTIFDGFAMFANYAQLKQLSKYQQNLERDTIQRTLLSVVSTYYNLVFQNQQIRSLKEAIAISKLQLGYASAKFDVGRVAKLDVLNAQVNFNTDTANLLLQVQSFNTTKIKLNQLLVRKLDENFSVPDTLQIEKQLVLKDILMQAQTANPTILSAQINSRLAEINLKQTRALRYPLIGVNSGYAFTNSKTPAGFTRTQDTKGFNYGLTASVPIFDGFNQQRRERVAKIQIDNADLQASRVKQLIDAQVNSLFVEYLSGLDFIKLEQSNVEIAKKNLEISLEKYRLGNITPLEVREAQRNLIDARTRFYNDLYQTKLAEISLKEIAGNITID